MQRFSCWNASRPALTLPSRTSVQPLVRSVRPEGRCVGCPSRRERTTRRTPRKLDRSLALSGFLLKCAFAHSCPGEAGFPTSPGCSNCELRPKPQNTVRTRRPRPKPWTAVPSEPKPRRVGIPPCGGLRWSVEGWAPPRDRCHPPKRVAVMRVSPHHSARFPGGHLPKDQTCRTRQACALRAIAKVSTGADTRNPKWYLIFAHCDEFSRTHARARGTPIVHRPGPIRGELHACHTQPVQSTP